MDPNPTTRITRVSTIQLLVTLGIIVGVEAALSRVPASALIQTGTARCLEIFLIIALFYLSDTDKGAAAIGLSKNRVLHGLNKGIIWSLGFAGVSAIAGCLLFLAGINPVHFFHGRVPDRTFEVVLLYIVGGIIAPVAEEIFSGDGVRLCQRAAGRFSPGGRCWRRYWSAPAYLCLPIRPALAFPCPSLWGDCLLSFL
ncbi:MAG: hypothetical protein R2874_09600 [Desulfobacterales bacterium]